LVDVLDPVVNLGPTAKFGSRNKSCFAAIGFIRRIVTGLSPIRRGFVIWNAQLMPMRIFRSGFLAVAAGKLLFDFCDRPIAGRY